MVSLAVTTYNRSEMTIKSFIKVINNNLIDDIVIQDDYSDMDVYCSLWNMIYKLNCKKIRLFRNLENKGPFLNKYEAVKNCKNDWIILLDSDNIIDSTYIETISKLDRKEDTLYCAEILYALDRQVNWSYKEFNKLIIDKENAKKHIDNGLFETWLNTGNYFFHKDLYLKNVEGHQKEKRLSVADSIYFSYLWLKGGNKMQIVPDLYYVHTIHEGSYYIHHRRLLRSIHSRIKQRIKLL